MFRKKTKKAKKATAKKNTQKKTSAKKSTTKKATTKKATTKKSGQKTTQKKTTQKKTTAKKGREMKTSSEYKKEIQILEKEIHEMQQKETEIKRRLHQYLERVGPDAFTKQMFPNGANISPRNLKVRSETLQEKQNKLQRLKEKYMDALKKELIENFMIENSDMKKDLKKVNVEKDETGTIMIVNLK